MENYAVCEVSNFIPEIKHGWKVKTVRRQGYEVKTLLYERWVSLDTETSWNHDEQNPVGWIYQWAFKFGGQVVIGRKPSELVEALRRLKMALELSKSRKLVVFVHNLSYDIQYLKQWLIGAFGAFKILAVKPHKFITFEVEGFIFKCSFKLSNKSLATWAGDLGTEHAKLKEDKAFYDEIHYQDEPLSRENWRYQILDAVVLDEAIEKQLVAYGDNILTVPLTSTGYVRREARRNYKKERKNRKAFVTTQLSKETYLACKEEFAGGLTHGNRFLCGKTVRPEAGEFIKHRDFRSHYPTQQRTQKFPVGKFNLWGEHLTIEEVRELVKDYCVLMKVTFQNVRVKKAVVLPILSVAKCYKGRSERLNMVEDNGRVLECKGVFTLYLTELDFHWISKQYEVEFYDIEKTWVAVKGYMPDYMKVTVDEFFLGKTKWKMELAKEKAKGEKADKERVIYLSLELMKSKNGLNGIYGMSATDIVRVNYEMDDAGEWKQEAPDAGEALKKYYGSENSFNRYQFGIYTTSHARNELLFYAEIIESNGGTVLYVDTDSIFYVSNERIEKAIEEENERRKARALSIGAFVEYEGKTVTYDSFDDEMEEITAFRFLHAKCYAYTYKEGSAEKMKCVIAGVPEYEDATHAFSREEELGGIDDLDEGKTFERCGGTRAIYVETPCGEMEINGHKTEVGASCIILPTTKTLHNQITIYEQFIQWEVE